MDFIGSALKLTEEDIRAAASLIAVEIAAIQAVAEVESLGSGFLKSRRPVILFESYQFHIRTKGRYDNSHPHISTKSWIRNYLGGEEEYTRLEEAIALDKRAALESASWGRFQIMGFNHLYCGFDSVEDFVQAHILNEREHLLAFCAFIKSMKLDSHLRNHDWISFARLYNGPGYARNKYDIRLANAYAKFKAKESAP